MIRFRRPLRIVRARSTFPRGARLVGLLLLPALAPSVAAQPSPERSTFPEALRQEISRRVDAHAGVVGLSVIDLEDGDRFGIREDEAFPSASVIKIPIMMEVFSRVEEGAADLEEPLTILDLDRTVGSGILRSLTTPKEITIWDATFLMIATSDNTATDLLLAKFRPRTVNRLLEEMGYETTRVYLPAVNAGPGESPSPDESGVFGFGVTTPRETAEILASIYRREAVSENASDRMMETLSAQFYDRALPRKLPAGATVAHKMGSTLTSRNDCGIVFGPERDFVLCVMTRDNEDRSWGIENEAYHLIGDLALLVYRALNPDSL